MAIEISWVSVLPFPRAHMLYYSKFLIKITHLWHPNNLINSLQFLPSKPIPNRSNNPFGCVPKFGSMTIIWPTQMDYKVERSTEIFPLTLLTTKQLLCNLVLWSLNLSHPSCCLEGWLYIGLFGCGHVGKGKGFNGEGRNFPHKGKKWKKKKEARLQLLILCILPFP